MRLSKISFLTKSFFTWSEQVKKRIGLIYMTHIILSVQNR